MIKWYIKIIIIISEYFNNIPPRKYIYIYKASKIRHKI